MCVVKYQTDEILDLLCSVEVKKSRVSDDLRVAVLLKSTHKMLQKELKVKKRISKKRKQVFTDFEIPKKPKVEVELNSHCEDEAAVMALLAHDLCLCDNPWRCCCT